MGQYRIWMAAKWQIGLMISFDVDQIIISFPFMELVFGLQKSASGIYIYLGKNFKE